MSQPEKTDDRRWLEVLAKGVAVLALREKMRENADATRLDQAQFLEALGLTQPEAAALLGISVNTLYSLASQQRSKKSRPKQK